MAAFSLYSNGNRPKDDDGELDLLRKIAAILWTISGENGLPPSLGDSEQQLLVKINNYLQPAGGGPDDDYRILDGELQLRNFTTGRFHTIALTGEEGEEQIIIGEGVE